MDEGLHLSRFEQELVRRLRTLPFAVRQHIARYVLRLQKEHGVEEEAAPAAEETTPAAEEPATGTAVWDLTHEDLWRLRQELDEEQGREG